MKIGVFDSGSGGRTTLAAIQTLLPENEYYYISDRAHCPYGTKSQSELLAITAELVRQLVRWGAEIIVIACNTATTQCIYNLRQLFPQTIFVGTEPALKPACDAGCQDILLLATPQTIASQQVSRLTSRFVNHQHLELLPCPGLADLIEQQVELTESSPLRQDPAPQSTQFQASVPQPIQFQNSASQPIHLQNPDLITTKLTELVATLPPVSQFDGVILGCTHYVLAREQVQACFPEAQLFDGNFGVARRVQALQQSI